MELLFSLTENQKQVNDILSEFGIPSEEDGSLLLMRELTNKGRNYVKSTAVWLRYLCCGELVII